MKPETIEVREADGWPFFVPDEPEADALRCVFKSLLHAIVVFGLRLPELKHNL